MENTNNAINLYTYAVSRGACWLQGLELAFYKYRVTNKDNKWIQLESHVSICLKIFSWDILSINYCSFIMSRQIILYQGTHNQKLHWTEILL